MKLSFVLFRDNFLYILKENVIFTMQKMIPDRIHAHMDSKNTHSHQFHSWYHCILANTHKSNHLPDPVMINHRLLRNFTQNCLHDSALHSGMG